jgi:DNA-binding CsgD family transcriptional regulator
MIATPLASAVNDLLLKLYRGSTEVPFSRFQDWSLNLLGGLVRFDAAWWGKAISNPSKILYVHLLNADKSILQDYGRIDGDDFFRDAMLASPGSTVNLNDLISRRDFERSPIYTRYGRKHRVEAAVGTVILEPVSSMIEFLTLWRFDPRWPFSDTDRLLIERIMPHLFEANRISRLVSLQGPMSSEAASDATHPWALTSPDDGVLLEVNATFVALAKREWPEWRGAILPTQLRKHLRNCEPYKGRAIAVDITDVEGYRLVVARAIQSKDRLGQRESEVLAMYVAGNSYRQIAQVQQRSPATVRNQLAQIYRKFGVHSKVELLRALQNGPPTGDPGIAPAATDPMNTRPGAGAPPSPPDQATA